MVQYRPKDHRDSTGPKSGTIPADSLLSRALLPRGGAGLPTVLLEEPDTHAENGNLDPHHTPCAKINLRRTTNLNIKVKTVKVVAKIGENRHNPGRQSFLRHNMESES